MARTRAAHLGPELRRPLVLDAALTLFARNGYDAASMQAIADAAGVSKPVLYSCYDGKEELFTALVQREDRRLWDLVEALMPRLGAVEDDETLLCQALTGLFRAVEESPDAFRVMWLAPHHQDRIDRGRVRRARRVHWEERVTAVVGARSPAPEREAELFGRLLVTAAELGCRTLLEQPGSWRPDELARHLARRLLRGLA